MRARRKTTPPERNTPGVSEFSDQWLAEQGHTLPITGGPSARLWSRLKLVASLVAERESQDVSPVKGPSFARAAIGAPVAHRLLWRNNLGKVSSLDLTGELVVGRDSRCALAFANPEVSRQHCVLRIVGGRVELRDLGSANGTWRNGCRIDAPQVLCDGDVIEVGGQAIAYIREL